jgi:hypothetical protein
VERGWGYEDDTCPIDKKEEPYKDPRIIAPKLHVKKLNMERRPVYARDKRGL